MIVPQAVTSCRLVAKLLVRYLRRWPLPWGDLIMMRKQLLTLKQLAERVPHFPESDVRWSNE